jgi:hypothetical protein
MPNLCIVFLNYNNTYSQIKEIINPTTVTQSTTSSSEVTIASKIWFLSLDLNKVLTETVK